MIRIDSLQHSVLVEGHRGHIMSIIIVMVERAVRWVVDRVVHVKRAHVHGIVLLRLGLIEGHALIGESIRRVNGLENSVVMIRHWCNIMGIVVVMVQLWVSVVVRGVVHIMVWMIVIPATVVLKEMR